MEHTLYSEDASDYTGYIAFMVTLTNLNDTALSIRRSIITMLETAGSGHSAGSLGMTDVFTTLYFAVAKHDPKNPTWEQRDRIMLSNGQFEYYFYLVIL